MSLFKKIVSIAAAPVTVIPKAAAQVVDNVSSITGLNNVPLIGNALGGVANTLALPYDATLGGKDSATLKSEAKDALLVGATVVTGGATAPVIAAGATYGADLLPSLGLSPKSNGILEAVGEGLGIPPGVLSKFLPSGNQKIPYSGGDDSGGYIPAKQTVEYGAPSTQNNLFPILAMGGGALVLIILLKKRR